MNNIVNKLMNFINESPTSYNAVNNLKEDLLARGFIYFNESDDIKFAKGKSYFTIRNGSSIIAFSIGKDYKGPFMITASHTDSPSFKIKSNPNIKEKSHNLLNVEPYGGMIGYSYFDRPLSLAGRLLIKNKNNQIEEKVIDIKRPLLVIPSLCIHFSREVNTNFKIDFAKDVRPLISQSEQFDLLKFIQQECNIENEILGYDLFLKTTEKGTLIGENNEYILSPRLDNLVNMYLSYQGFVESKDNNLITKVFASFDNEEVGSSSLQGANSNFLESILKRILEDTSFNDYDLSKMLEKSFMMSLDNGHAIHPNHLDVCDLDNGAYLNKGIMVKINPSLAYVSDGLSLAIFKMMVGDKVKYQLFHNNNKIRGGSTLGNILLRTVSLKSIDLGLPTLGMHSLVELCGVNDVIEMYNTVSVFYRSYLNLDQGKISIIEYD